MVPVKVKTFVAPHVLLLKLPGLAEAETPLTLNAVGRGVVPGAGALVGVGVGAFVPLTGVGVEPSVAAGDVAAGVIPPEELLGGGLLLVDKSPPQAASRSVRMRQAVRKRARVDNLGLEMPSNIFLRTP